MDDNGLHWSTITEPFENFVSKIFDYLPQIVGAIVLFLAFWLLAKVASWAVRNVLKKAKVDERLAKADLVRSPQEHPVANGVGTAVYWLIWVCFVPAVVAVLQLEGLMGPIETLFDKVFEAIPNVLAAILVLVVAWVLGSLLARVVIAMLTRAGFNRILVNAGLAKTEPNEDKVTPSKVVGYALLAIIMLLAATGAAELLKWNTGTELIRDFLVFAGQVAVGIIVIGVGVFLASAVAKVIKSRMLAILAQAAIMVLAVAMGLRAMGLANEIVIIGFAALVGAIAVAFALAVGLGGRDPAGKEVDRWIKALRSESTKEKGST